MKKIAIFFGISLLLAACNMPSPTPDPAIAIATNVALVLTNAPSPTPFPDLNSGILTTATPAPIQTEDLPVATQTQLAVTPTEPATQQLTSTPTSVPTVPASAEDPVTRLGEPSKKDSFDNTGSTWTYDDDWFYTVVSGGQLHLFSKGTAYWNSWYTIQPSMKNLYLEATLTMPNCQGKDRIGLAFRLTGNEYYFLGLTCDGTIGLSRYTADNRVVEVLSYKSTEKLNPTSQPNRIGIQANGSDFQLYANGNLVGQVTDDTLPNAGSYGFVSMSTGTVNMKTSVDELSYWLLP